MERNYLIAYSKAKRSHCDMNDYIHVNEAYFGGTISLVEYANVMNIFENNKFFEAHECMDALQEYPIKDITFDIPVEPTNNNVIDVTYDNDKKFASVNVDGNKITLVVNADPFIQDTQEIFNNIDIWLQHYIYKKYPTELIVRTADSNGVSYSLNMDAIENAGPIQFPTGCDNGFSGVRNGSGDATATIGKIAKQKPAPIFTEKSEESEQSEIVLTFGEGKEGLLASKEQFMRYLQAQNDGKYNMFMDARKVIDEYFTDVPIFEEQYFDILSKYSEYVVKYGSMQEGILGAIAGGAIGITIGPSIGKAIAKAFGCEKGAFYDFLTSRAFTTILGAYIGGKK